MTQPPEDKPPLIPDVLPPTRPLTGRQHGGNWITEYRPRPVPRPDLPRRFGCLGMISRVALALWYTLMHVEHGIAPGGHLRAVARVVGRVIVLLLLGWIALTVLLPVAVLIAKVAYEIMWAVIYLVIAVLLVAALISSVRR